MSVFISHSSMDRPFVEQELITFLKTHGVESFYAVTDIKTAADWERSIVRALQSCDHFLVVLSPHSVASEWVRSEVHWAMENRVGRIVPFFLAACNTDELHLRLRDSAKSGKSFDLNYMNFRLAKGTMCERVLIAPTGGITKFVQAGTYLDPIAAAKFYVAVTRAAQSVAIIVDEPGDSSLPYWVPE